MRNMHTVFSSKPLLFYVIRSGRVTESLSEIESGGWEGEVADGKTQEAEKPHF